MFPLLYLILVIGIFFLFLENPARDLLILFTLLNTYFLLACIIFIKTSVVIFVFFLLYVMCPHPSWILSSFSLFIINFQQVDYDLLMWFSLGLSSLWIHWDSWIFKFIIFIKIWNFYPIFLQVFSCSSSPTFFSHPLSFWDFYPGPQIFSLTFCFFN